MDASRRDSLAGHSFLFFKIVGSAAVIIRWSDSTVRRVSQGCETTRGCSGAGVGSARLRGRRGGAGDRAPQEAGHGGRGLDRRNRASGKKNESAITAGLQFAWKITNTTGNQK